jgi:hypothetical protein
MFMDKDYVVRSNFWIKLYEFLTVISTISNDIYTYVWAYITKIWFSQCAISRYISIDIWITLRVILRRTQTFYVMNSLIYDVT